MSAQGFEPLVVICLVKGDSGVFPDALLYYLGDDFHLVPQFRLPDSKSCQVKDCRLCLLECFDVILPARERDVGGGDETALDVFLIDGAEQCNYLFIC